MRSAARAFSCFRMLQLLGVVAKKATSMAVSEALKGEFLCLVEVYQYLEFAKIVAWPQMRGTFYTPTHHAAKMRPIVTQI